MLERRAERFRHVLLALDVLTDWVKLERRSFRERVLSIPPARARALRHFEPAARRADLWRAEDMICDAVAAASGAVGGRQPLAPMAAASSVEDDGGFGVTTDASLALEQAMVAFLRIDGTDGVEERVLSTAAPSVGSGLEGDAVEVVDASDTETEELDACGTRLGGNPCRNIGMSSGSERKDWVLTRDSEGLKIIPLDTWMPRHLQQSIERIPPPPWASPTCWQHGFRWRALLALGRGCLWARLAGKFAGCLR